MKKMARFITSLLPIAGIAGDVFKTGVAGGLREYVFICHHLRATALLPQLQISFTPCYN
ncbi:MAG: hypothetical protein WBN75_11925 [Verrucomicrobiia bacterium]